MQYNVTVIGSGPGGYVAAIRCAQLGMKTAIIEKYDTLGGTCLNVGCIPSKAMLDSSEHFINAKEHFAEHGIDIPAPKVNIGQMIKRKSAVVKSNVDGIAFLMKKNKIDVHQGVGSFVDKNTIKITAKDGKESIVTTEKVIIATGSKPTPLPFAAFDKKRIISSTEALELKGSSQKLNRYWRRSNRNGAWICLCAIGFESYSIEFLDSLIPTMDGTMGKELQKVAKKLGMDVFVGHKVTAVEAKGNEVTVKAEPKNGGAALEFKGDYCLVSIGRRPYTDGLGLDKVGIETVKGQIPVDDHLKTKVDNIWAIGDVVRGAMLAHKAEEEGVCVAEQIAGQKPHINYLLIPGVVYTWPEVASVGYTEEQLKEQGRAYKAGSFPYKALGRARASMDTDGLVKVLADKNTDEILGVHIIGARAADMIAAGVTAMEFRASAEDVARMSHAHPTYMEAVKEACLAATANRPIHI